MNNYSILARFLASLVSFVGKLENKMKFNMYIHIHTFMYTYKQTHKQNWAKRLRNACMNNDLLGVFWYGTVRMYVVPLYLFFEKKLN